MKNGIRVCARVTDISPATSRVYPNIHPSAVDLGV